MSDGTPDVETDTNNPEIVVRRIEAAGLTKAQLGVLPTLTLAVMAGAFISFGAMLFTLVAAGSGLGMGTERLVGGIAFSFGLILIVMSGAELFTGNNLIVMAWTDRKVTTAAVMRNWTLVYAGNLVGALATATCVYLSGTLSMGDGALSREIVAIAREKVALPLDQALIRGVLCNGLVCLAVWFSFAARNISGKVLVIIIPISAFVALGFEHSIANMYFIPVAMFLDSSITIGHLVGNLVPVTVGNIIGGCVLVGLVYWIVYRRAGHRPS